MKKLPLIVWLGLQVSACFAAWPIELPWMNAHADSPNKTYTSTAHPNAVFVVEAYFNGCHWCHANAPRVNALATEFKDNDRVQFLDVGVDGDDAEYQSWISSTSPNHPVLKDPDGQSFLTDFRIEGYPTTLVLDCHGQEQYRHVGSWEDDGAGEVRNAVKAALAQPGCQSSY